MKAGSSSNVKAQSHELVELDSTILREYRKISNKTNEFMKSWVDQRKQLTCPEVTKKETEKLKIDKCQNSDLSKLKDIGGPFVSAPEVDLYVAREDLTPKEKDTRLYLKVRYASGSCLSLLKSSDIFWLNKYTKPWAWMSTAPTWNIFWEGWNKCICYKYGFPCNIGKVNSVNEYFWQYERL